MARGRNYADRGMQYRPLEGSERQVAWARKLRDGIVERAYDDYLRLHATIDRSEAAQPDNAAAAQTLREIADAAYDRIVSETSATWWIDRRDAAGVFGAVANAVKAERLASV